MRFWKDNSLLISCYHHVWFYVAAFLINECKQKGLGSWSKELPPAARWGTWWWVTTSDTSALSHARSLLQPDLETVRAWCDVPLHRFSLLQWPFILQQEVRTPLMNVYVCLCVHVCPGWSSGFLSAVGLPVFAYLSLKREIWWIKAPSSKPFNFH